MSFSRRLLPFAAATGLLVFAACGQVPQATEDARGLFEGLNLFVALTVVLVVTAGLLLTAAYGIDRYVRSRRALEEASPPSEQEEEEEGEEVVAGIGVGSAPVPRWLYGVYVLIPVFALAYVVSNIAPEPTIDDTNGVPPPPPEGPQTEVTMVAQGILFDVDEIVLLADSEVTIHFDNQDTAVPHDLVIWEDQAAAQRGDQAARLAGTNVFPGVATQTFTWETGPPAQYYFNCTIHPASMFGDVIVEEG